MSDTTDNYDTQLADIYYRLNKLEKGYTRLVELFTKQNEALITGKQTTLRVVQLLDAQMQKIEQLEFESLLTLKTIKKVAARGGIEMVALIKDIVDELMVNESDSAKAELYRMIDKINSDEKLKL